MAPLSGMSHDKCRSESSESKANRFSFRWLLKRSKSSKSAKEMAQAEKRRNQNVTVSKSCDSGIAGIDKCSTFLLWKLLPASGKALITSDKQRQNSDSKKAFKTSFSCGDVSGILPQAKTASLLSHSNYNIPSVSGNASVPLKHSGHSSYNMCKRIASLDYLGPRSSKSNEQAHVPNFIPDVCQLVLCKLCLSMVYARSMYILEDCGCSFCFTCMQQYLLINIKEGNVSIMCPDAECPSKGEVLIPEVQEIVGDEVFYMFQKFKLNNEVEMDPCRTWCLTPGCETICNFQPSSNESKGVSVYCLNCKLTFCSMCKVKWHTGKTCEEMRLILQEEEDFNTSDDDGDPIIKRCPSCRVPIERDEGCAQMMCKRCKHVFCWHCLASLDDDFLLRHYDKGPCRNKLGHSRASMVWHRTQVVGIFAGFSFLLLVASPILLLAAPCLLCCRCKNCKLLNEEATLL